MFSGISTDFWQFQEVIWRPWLRAEGGWLVLLEREFFYFYLKIISAWIKQIMLWQIACNVLDLT